MSEDEKPARRRFQMHLSTAVAMMFVEGVIMWANFGYRPYPRSNYHCDGWPFDLNYWGDRHFNLWGYVFKGRFVFRMIDLLVAIIIPFAIWFVCGWWISRRARAALSNE